MLRRLGVMSALALVLGTVGLGCVVRETRVAQPSATCRGGIWVEGRYDRGSRWHPGHWRCPGHVERIDIY